MRAMKDSGIEWIGAVPEEWGYARIGSLYTIRNQKVNDIDFLPLSVTKAGIVPQMETVAKTNAHEDRKLVRKGDFVINSRSDRRGSCGISSFDGSVSLINTVMYPIEDMDPGYYDWFFHTVQFADEFYRWGHGIVDDLWTTGWRDMKNIVITRPPINEQRLIADFLDAKCAAIDRLSAVIQSEIDTLDQYKRSVITEAVTKGLDPDAEMKDSGIEWIGEIPKEWKTEKAKFYLRRNEIRNPGNQIVLSVYREYGVIPKDSRDDNHNVTSEDVSKYKYVKPGYLVINKMKAWQGSMGISQYEGIVSPAYFIYEIIDNTLTDKYLHYLLRYCYKDEFRRISGGIREGQWDLSPEAFDNTLVPVPSVEEQRRIADFLDAKCSRIDALIAKKREKLTVLDSYKKSLIYEYVTGKKEVPLP